MTGMRSASFVMLERDRTARDVDQEDDAPYEHAFVRGLLAALGASAVVWFVVVALVVLATA